MAKTHPAICRKCGETTDHYDSNGKCIPCKTAYAASHYDPSKRHAAYNIARPFYDPQKRHAIYEANKEAILAQCRVYHATHGAARRSALKVAAFNAYGGPQCACCGETLLDGLTIDHVNGGGTAHRAAAHGSGNRIYAWLKGHNYPPGFQVLCGTCNFAKGTRDHCPHKDLRPTEVHMRGSQ